jgi:hypothetical protein
MLDELQLDNVSVHHGRVDGRVIPHVRTNTIKKDITLFTHVH